MTKVPEHVASWLPTLSEALPDETRATCSNCAMCPSESEAPLASAWFDPSLKCCAHVPNLPNFLVGRILRDEGEGATSVRGRIATGSGVTPLGVMRPQHIDLVMRKTQDRAGRAKSLRCPHFVEASGACGIWKHRNAVCTTFFCRHTRGMRGLRGWHALRALLEAVERDLAVHCASTVGIPAPVLATLVTPKVEADPLRSEDLDGLGDTPSRRALWGEHYERQEAFYLQCAEIVDAMTWEDVRRVAGPQVSVLEDNARREIASLASEAIPGRLQLGAMQVRGIGAQGTNVVTYSPLDPIVLPTALMSILHYFDGSTWADIEARIAAERGLELEPSLMRALLDWGIVVPA